MKLLVHGFKDQPMYSLFNRLASCLENSQHQVLFSSQENSSDTKPTEDIVKRINPDAVIFNKKTQLRASSTRSLYLDVSKIEPFAYLPQSKHRESSPLYLCDVVYIGNPTAFGDGLKVLTESEFVFKFFEKKPAFVSGYCGSLDGASVGQDVIVRSAKAAVTMPSDKYRLLNIIVSGGNPVVFQNPEQFRQDIEKAISGVRFFGGISRHDVIKDHTSHDRMIEFLKRVRLDSMLSTVIENKKRAWGTE